MGGGGSGVLPKKISGLNGVNVHLLKTFSIFLTLDVNKMIDTEHGHWSYTEAFSRLLGHN